MSAFKDTYLLSLQPLHQVYSSWPSASAFLILYKHYNFYIDYYARNVVSSGARVSKLFESGAAKRKRLEVDETKSSPVVTTSWTGRGQSQELLPGGRCPST